MKLQEYLDLFGVKSIEELNAAQHEILTYLTDIDAGHVALVDRGANKRRLLIAKGADMPDEDLLGPPAEVDDDGNLIDPAPETDVNKAAIPPPVRAGMLKKANAAAERLAAVIATLKGTGGDMASVGNELKAIGTLVGGIASGYPSPTTKESGMSDDKPKTDTKKADAETDAPPAEPQAPAPVDAIEIDDVTITGPLAGLLNSYIAKGGAKMAGDRLKRFKKVAKEFDELLQELDGSGKTDAERMLEKLLESVQKSADQQTAAQQALIEVLKGAAAGATGQPIPPGQTTGEDDLKTGVDKAAGKPEDEVVWESDLAAAAVKKANS